MKVGDTSMEPAYWEGDVVFVHPSVAPAPGCDILLRKSEGIEQRAMIKYLVRSSDTHWHLRQWNPAPGEKQDFAVLKSDWPKVDRIVGSYFADD
jgi:phage repressor protein C with HTH and peptisase S24 domain